MMGLGDAFAKPLKLMDMIVLTGQIRDALGGLQAIAWHETEFSLSLVPKPDPANFNGHCPTC